MQAHWPLPRTFGESEVTCSGHPSEWQKCCCPCRHFSTSSSIVRLARPAQRVLRSKRLAQPPRPFDIAFGDPNQQPALRRHSAATREVREPLSEERPRRMPCPHVLLHRPDRRDFDAGQTEQGSQIFAPRGAET